VISAAVLGNRMLALMAGFWLKVPTFILLGVLLALDAVQIPMYYWLYGKGERLLRRLPARFQKSMDKDWSATPFGRWVLSVRGVGVMVIAALPTFGGGMWTAALLSYSSGLSRRTGAVWMMMGSLLSYATLWWIGVGLISAAKHVNP